MKTMKILLGMCIMMLTTSYAIGQNSAFQKLYSEYSGKEGFTTVSISSEMFGLFASVADESDKDMKEFNEVVEKLNGLKILSFQSTKDDDFNFKTRILDKLSVKDYKELMVVKENQKEVRFLIDENKDGRIGELLMLVEESKGGVVMSISGDIDLKTISKISRNMKISGMENLGKIEDGEQNK